MLMKTYYGTKVIQAQPETQGLEDGDGVRDVEGYKVIYSGGYESWSPKEAFEEAYRESGNLTFGHAIEALKRGERVAIISWNKAMWLELQVPDKNSRMTLPYIYITYPHGVRVPWFPGQSELLAENWEIVAA